MDLLRLGGRQSEPDTVVTVSGRSSIHCHMTSPLPSYLNVVTSLNFTISVQLLTVECNNCAMRIERQEVVRRQEERGRKS